MLLYGVFYTGRSFDQARPLTAEDACDPSIRYAVCVNGTPRYIQPNGNGGWRDLTPLERADLSRVGPWR